MALDGKKILVLCGSSGIGLGVATAAIAQGAKVTIASRSTNKVHDALARLGGSAAGTSLDTGDNAALEVFFDEQGCFDHVFCSAAQTMVAAARDLPLESAFASFESKFWGAYRLARSAKIVDGGALTLTSGFLSVRPKAGAAIQGAINAALEGLTRGLALEFAPVRVNCVSPGLVMTEMYNALNPDRRHAIFDAAAKRLPVGRVGTPEDVAAQVIALMSNAYMTGTTVFVDGGGAIA